MLKEILYLIPRFVVIGMLPEGVLLGLFILYIKERIEAKKNG